MIAELIQCSLSLLRRLLVFQRDRVLWEPAGVVERVVHKLERVVFLHINGLGGEGCEN